MFCVIQWYCINIALAQEHATQQKPSCFSLIGKIIKSINKNGAGGTGYLSVFKGYFGAFFFVFFFSVAFRLRRS